MSSSYKVEFKDILKRLNKIKSVNEQNAAKDKAVRNGFILWNFQYTVLMRISARNIELSETKEERKASLNALNEYYNVVKEINEQAENSVTEAAKPLVRELQNAIYSYVNEARTRAMFTCNSESQAYISNKVA